MAACCKCNVVEESIDTYQLAKCDVCGIMLCLNCSTLSASEHKNVTVKKRSPCVKNSCKECNVTNKADGYVKAICTEVKNSIMKILQKCFDELKVKTDKVDKAVDSVSKALGTLKNDNIAPLFQKWKFLLQLSPTLLIRTLYSCVLWKL